MLLVVRAGSRGRSCVLHADLPGDLPIGGGSCRRRGSNVKPAREQNRFGYRALESVDRGPAFFQLVMRKAIFATLVRTDHNNFHNCFCFQVFEHETRTPSFVSLHRDWEHRVSGKIRNQPSLKERHRAGTTVQDELEVFASDWRVPILAPVVVLRINKEKQIRGQVPHQNDKLGELLGARRRPNRVIQRKYQDFSRSFA